LVHGRREEVAPDAVGRIGKHGIGRMENEFPSMFPGGKWMVGQGIGGMRLEPVHGQLGILAKGAGLDLQEVVDGFRGPFGDRRIWFRGKGLVLPMGIQAPIQVFQDAKGVWV
jgi:hypothetical protein